MYVFIFLTDKQVAMHLDEVVGMIISEYYKQKKDTQKVMSRQKLPCTRCGAVLSTTWRPGPCGASSLCNACGVMYMVRNQRPRMIDLVLSEERALWMERRRVAQDVFVQGGACAGGRARRASSGGSHGEYERACAGYCWRCGEWPKRGTRLGPRRRRRRFA